MGVKSEKILKKLQEQVNDYVSEAFVSLHNENEMSKAYLGNVLEQFQDQIRKNDLDLADFIKEEIDKAISDVQIRNENIRRQLDSRIDRVAEKLVRLQAHLNDIEWSLSELEESPLKRLKRWFKSIFKPKLRLEDVKVRKLDLTDKDIETILSKVEQAESEEQFKELLKT